MDSLNLLDIRSYIAISDYQEASGEFVYYSGHSEQKLSCVTTPL